MIIDNFEVICVDCRWAGDTWELDTEGLSADRCPKCGSENLEDWDDDEHSPAPAGTQEEQ